MRDTSDWVKIYEKELKDNKGKKKYFNVWGFLFSAFYFAYIGSPWFFMLFALLPWIFMVVLIPFADIIVSGENKDFTVICGFLISHIIAGVVAGMTEIKYKEKYVEQNKNIDTSKPAEYFAIPLWRLFLFTFITFGLYTLYWGYRNWKSYKEATSDNVTPVMRAVFFNIVAPSLFVKMEKTLKSGKPMLFYGIMCFVITALDRIDNKFIDSIDDKNLYLCGMLLFVIISLVYSLFLLPVQRAVNEYTAGALKKSLEERFYPWELVIVAVGVISNVIFGVNLYGNWKEMPTKEEAKIIFKTSEIYGALELLPSICAKEGYVMHKYPQEARDYYQNDIIDLEHLTQRSFEDNVEWLENRIDGFQYMAEQEVKENVFKPLAEHLGQNGEYKSFYDVCRSIDEKGFIKH
ncbi:MAG: hypothetical protein IJ532_02675 [Alphaproteobacteria bacterium]|nr:hypothetical protein [Alphaproteobacteria bacterium]